MASSGIFGQTNSFSQTKSIEFQNEQRALNLSLLESDIKKIDDAPLRCSLRLQIIEFIYENKVQSYTQAADGLILKCFDDINENSNQFSESAARYWKSRLIGLVKTHSPNLISEIEKQYSTKSADDLLTKNQELSFTENPTKIINEIISDIRQGNVSPNISFLIVSLQEKHPESFVRLLTSLLSFFETSPEKENLVTVLNSLSNFYLDKSFPLENKKRFLLIAIALGQKALAEQESSTVAQQSRHILRMSLLSIKEFIPSQYPQALAIFSTLDSKLANENVEREEVFKRIRESKNKLQKTIDEAEFAKDKDLQQFLWMEAAKLALPQKNFQKAVDLALKIESDDKNLLKWRNQFLLNDVLRASLEDEDFESAEYVVAKLESPINRADSLLKIASKFIKLNNIDKADIKISESLKEAGKIEINTAKTNLFLEAVQVTAKFNKLKAFEIMISAIDSANKVSAPDFDDKIGTEKRKNYVSEILLPVSVSFLQAFKDFSESDISNSDSLVMGIHYKGWRIAAQISIEKVRKYSLKQTKSVTEK